MPENPAPDGTPPGPRVPRRPPVVVALGVLGLVLTVCGFVALARGPLAVGWFAYAPLSEAVVVNRGWRWAPYLLVGGCLLLGGAVGYTLGVRRSRA